MRTKNSKIRVESWKIPPSKFTANCGRDDDLHNPVSSGL
jgi:hypothetical protein